MQPLGLVVQPDPVPPVARDGPVDDAAAGAPPFPRAQTAKPRKVDLGSIRDKLKKKKTAPRFM